MPPKCMLAAMVEVIFLLEFLLFIFIICEISWRHWRLLVDTQSINKKGNDI